MNQAFKKKLPMIILLCIMLGLVFFLLNSSGFGAITTSGNPLAGTPSTWTNDWSAATDYAKFLFPDPYLTTTAAAYGFTTPTARYTINNIFVTSYIAIAAISGSIPAATAALDYTSVSSQSNYTYVPYTGVTLYAEYALFNLCMHQDTRIAAFMNNDYPLIPLLLTAPTVSGGIYTAGIISASSMSTNLNSTVLSYYTNIGNASTTYFTPATGGGTYGSGNGNGAISFNQAIAIPAVVGTPGSNQKSANATSSVGTNYQRVRLNIILGVLTAMHLLLNKSPASIPTGGTLQSGVNGRTDSISYDLINIYNPANNPLAPSTSYTIPSNWSSSISSFGQSTIPTFNVLHAMYMTLMARDNWINGLLAPGVILYTL